MGTRSLTRWFNEPPANGKKAVELVTMYRQMDGYPSGHGADLLRFLLPIKMVNGISNYDAIIANGAGCLAAQGVAFFKLQVNESLRELVQKGVMKEATYDYVAGGIYLYPVGSNDCGEEYVYEVRPQGEGKAIQVVVKRPGWTEKNWEVSPPKVIKRHRQKVLFRGTVAAYKSWLDDGAKSDNDEN